MFASQRICSILVIDRKARVQRVWQLWAFDVMRSVAARMKQTKVELQFEYQVVHLVLHFRVDAAI